MSPENPLAAPSQRWVVQRAERELRFIEGFTPQAPTIIPSTWKLALSNNFLNLFFKIK